MDGSTSDELARRAAERVREVIAEAESRAEEIVRDAEREAERIRSRAGAQRAEPEPPRDAAAEPPESASPDAPGPAAADADDAAVRLVAMKLALDGGTRERIAAELESRFGAADRQALVDDVLTRAGR